MIALTIAGSDSGGGAGIQADLKTFSALGVYGASVITAVTAQNTLGVTAVHPVPADIVLAQFDAVLGDLAVAAIKIGMLADASLIEELAMRLASFPGPIILDPVMVAASGDRLVSEEAMAATRNALFEVVTLITPNVLEAGVLLGGPPAKSVEDLAVQARALNELGPAVLLKGGHLEADESTDILFGDGAARAYTAPRVATRNTHGTGCTLSSAVAAYMARGFALDDAVARAKTYLQNALTAADRLTIGRGHGPVHHFHEWWTDSAG